MIFHSVRPLLLSLVSLSLAGCSAPATKINDAAAEAGATEDTSMAAAEASLAEAPVRAILLDNDWVRVSRVTLAPGADLPDHQGGRRAIYALGDYVISWREGDAAPVPRTWSQGDVHFHNAGRHAMTNTGQTPAIFLVFERKDTALLPTSDAATGDIVAADASHSQLRAENEHFRVIEVSLPPGAAQPQHDGRPRIVHALSDYDIAWKEEDQPEATRHWDAGQTHWHDAGQHAARNIGKTEARWLIVALKD